MERVTVTLDDRTAEWAGHEARRRKISVPRFLASLIRTQMRASQRYEVNMRQYLDRPAVRLRMADEPYTGRDALHERKDHE